MECSLHRHCKVKYSCSSSNSSRNKYETRILKQLFTQIRDGTYPGPDKNVVYQSRDKDIKTIAKSCQDCCIIYPLSTNRHAIRGFNQAIVVDNVYISIFKVRLATNICYCFRCIFQMARRFRSKKKTTSTKEATKKKWMNVSLVMEHRIRIDFHGLNTFDNNGYRVLLEIDDFLLCSYSHTFFGILRIIKSSRSYPLL